MNTLNKLLKNGLYAFVALMLLSCKDDNNPDPEPPEGDEKVYALGLGVTTTEATTNYVLQTSDLMNGTLSLINNGLLQQGYRDYAQVGSNFYSVGGLGVTDVNTIYLDESGKIATRTGLNLITGVTDFKDVDGKGNTVLAVAVPAGPSDGTDVEFVLVDVAQNSIKSTAKVPVRGIHTGGDWMWHTGIVVRGNQAFQTFSPFNIDWTTTDTDTALVAVYSYPEFQLQKVIKDPRTGPAGAFGTRSGIFVTESGDIYTVSHTGYGYSQGTKAPAILKIPSGSTDFDGSYYFNTADAANGGRIVHALYIGNNKLFATIRAGERLAEAQQWVDDNLKFAIVDLASREIKAVSGSPVFSGNGGRSFAALHDDGKVYTAATVDGVCNIYEIDVAQATSKKGAIVDATFVGGLARLK